MTRRRSVSVCRRDTTTNSMVCSLPVYIPWAGMPVLPRSKKSKICREICTAMERSELHRRYRMGISIGVAELAPEMAGKALVARADKALYRAKSAGGGVVVGAEPELLSSME